MATCLLYLFLNSKSSLWFFTPLSSSAYRSPLRHIPNERHCAFFAARCINFHQKPLQIASPPSRGTSNSTFSDARSPLLGYSLSLFTVLSVSVCERLTDLKNFSASHNVQSSPLCNFNKVIMKKCIGEEIYPEVYLLLFFMSIQLTSYLWVLNEMSFQKNSFGFPIPNIVARNSR